MDVVPDPLIRLCPCRAASTAVRPSYRRTLPGDVIAPAAERLTAAKTAASPRTYDRGDEDGHLEERPIPSWSSRQARPAAASRAGILEALAQRRALLLLGVLGTWCASHARCAGSACSAAGTLASVARSPVGAAPAEKSAAASWRRALTSTPGLSGHRGGIVGGALLWITQDGAGDLYFLPTTDIVQLIVLQAIRELGADLVRLL